MDVSREDINDGKKKFQKVIKVNVLCSCLAPACVFVFWKKGLTELQKYRLQQQVQENNWTRRLAGVDRAETRIMKDPGRRN